MNLVNMITRRDPLKRAFVTLEDGMSDVLSEEFQLPPLPGSFADIDGDLSGSNLVPDLDTPSISEVAPEVGDRVTPHAQNRLAACNAADQARTKLHEELGRIGVAVSAIVATQNQNRDFLEDVFADIHRANDLELANAAYAAENRRLVERADKLEKLRGRYDQLIDVLKRRETKLLQESEKTHEEIAALKLELIEARSAAKRAEALQAELQAELADAGNETQRFMRDAEIHRERNIGLTLDLDQAQKRQAETRRKHEDLAAVHASDSARMAEVTARLASEENETSRLQKLNDALEAKLGESNESAARLSGELASREKRFQSEVNGLKTELQALASRLQASSGDQRGLATELNTLRTRFSDLESEKQIVEKKLAVVTSELDTERRLGASQAGSSVNEEHRRETERMRSEILALQDTVRRLRQHEASYSASRAKTREATAAAPASNGAAALEYGSRSTGPGRTPSPVQSA